MDTKQCTHAKQQLEHVRALKGEFDAELVRAVELDNSADLSLFSGEIFSEYWWDPNIKLGFYLHKPETFALCIDCAYNMGRLKTYE